MLTKRMKAFAEIYIAQTRKNVTEAAKKAGYSEATASAAGCKMIKHPDVKAYIKERMGETEEIRTATLEEVMEFLTGAMNNKENKMRDRIRAAHELKEIIVDANGGKSEEDETPTFHFNFTDLSMKDVDTYENA